MGVDIFTQLTTLRCYKCVVTFGIDGELYRRRAEDGDSFWCPNGHSQAFSEPETVRLRKERDKLKQEAENARKRLIWAENREATAIQERDQAKKAHAVTKGKLTKTRNRIAHGVCPCCNRSFVDVARHMTTKHPEYKDDKTD